MPEENKIKKEDPKVDLDTSGPEVDVTLPEEKKEEVIENKEQETVKEVEKEEVNLWNQHVSARSKENLSVKDLSKE